ncbi:MAG: tryptophan synthase subunit alpha [Bacteroidetes bacterium]|nr:tryptophan synthase subunit alpha [Bacteroidota bacterium]
MSNNQEIKIMGHLVAGYPNAAGFEAACSAMADSGIEILEIQIPFSDPTADGPVNTEAGETALRNGFSVHDFHRYLDFASARGFEEIHVMTYANIIYRYGIRKFIDDMEAAHVTGIIIPDLPIEDEEGFYAYASQEGLQIDAVPVAVVNMISDRIQMLRDLHPERCYVSLRQGVTGTQTIMDDETIQFLDCLGVPKLYAGFGISTRDQVEALQGHAYAAVVGSYFTRIIRDAGLDPETIYTNLYNGAIALK